MLEVKELCKSYGTKRVLNQVSLSVESGKICGLLGLNGAGKSTLMKIVCGLAFADGGEVFVDGQKLENGEGDARIGFMIENPAFYRELSGRANLRALAALYPEVDDARVDEVLETVGLGGAANEAVKKYSLGMKQRLYFAYAVMNRPRLLILDEPFNGIDPVGIRLFKDLIQRLTSEGCAVLLSGHMIAALQDLCDSVCIIDRGKVLFSSDHAREQNLEEIFLSLVSESGDVQ